MAKNYQTLAEVRQAARSKKTAIKSSIRHWTELSTAPPKDLIEANENHYKSGLYPAANQCALCVKNDFQNNCRDCPLDGCGNNSPFNMASTAFKNIMETKTKSEKDAAVKRFRRRAKKMVKILEDLL